MARRIPIGFFQVDDPGRTPEGTFLWPLSWGHIESWDAGNVGNRPIILQVDVNEAMMRDEAEMVWYLDTIKQQMKGRGLSPVAIAFGEEWYLGFSKSWALFQGLNRIQWADAVKARIDRAHVLARQRWPHTYSIQFEQWFNNDQSSLPKQYYAPAYNVDVLGLDPFLYAEGNQHWGTQGMPLTPDAPYQKFQLEVARLYQHAAAYGKWLLMVPQAFSDTSAEWKVAPTAQQLRWWFDLAQRMPQVIGIGYFARFSLTPAITALDKNDELLAEVKRECAEMGYTL